MTVPVSNVVIATDSFTTWVGVTNLLADVMSTKTLTADATAAGGNVVGNAQLIGIFNANTIAIGTALRGGTIGTSANLTITSNAIFSGANVSVSGNVIFNNSNTYVNSTSFVVQGTTSNTTSNVSITNSNTNISTVAFGVQGVSTLVGNTVLKANSSLSSFSLSSNATVSNLDVSVNLTTVSGNVNVDTGTFFVDATNNRIGILNTTPDAELTVTGSANVSGAFRIGTVLTVVNAASVGNNLAVNGTANVTTAVNKC